MSITAKDIGGFFKKYPFSAPCGIVCLTLIVTLFLRSGATEAAEARLTELRSQGERFQENINRSTSMGEQIEALKEANARLFMQAVQPSELAGNLQYFYRLESDTGVALIDLRQLNPPAPAKGTSPTYFPLPYTVAVQGSYPQVMEFLRRLERGPHFTRVKSASMTPAGGGASNAFTLSLSIDLLGKS